MNERLRELLEHSVEQYIREATPIASGSLVSVMDVPLSSATIRNDLKTLEQMGYLKQVHTSGGRIPTTQGYRTYVDGIMRNMNIDGGEFCIAAENIMERTGNLPDIIETLCRRLSDTFNYPIIVKGRFDNLEVTDVKVLPLIEGKTLVLINTKVGSITQTLDTEVLSIQECMDASSALTSACRGLSLKGMMETLPEISGQLRTKLEFFGALVEGLAKELGRALGKNLSRNINMIKLLDLPDYADLNKVKRLGRAIEDDITAEELLEKEGAIVIGAELENEKLESTSVVKFNYKIDGVAVASVGIVGPERMDYKQLISALHALMVEARAGPRASNETKELVNSKKRKEDCE